MRNKLLEGISLRVEPGNGECQWDLSIWARTVVESLGSELCAYSLLVGNARPATISHNLFALGRMTTTNLIFLMHMFLHTIKLSSVV